VGQSQCRTNWKVCFAFHARLLPFSASALRLICSNIGCFDVLHACTRTSPCLVGTYRTRYLYLPTHPICFHGSPSSIVESAVEQRGHPRFPNTPDFRTISYTIAPTGNRFSCWSGSDKRCDVLPINACTQYSVVVLVPLILSTEFSWS
jgi:hypothetical protein